MSCQLGLQVHITAPDLQVGLGTESQPVEQSAVHATTTELSVLQCWFLGMVTGVNLVKIGLILQ